MLDVLFPLITEADNVSTELLDIILINIVEPNKSQRKNAYQLAKELIKKTHDTLEQYIVLVSIPYGFKHFDYSYWCKNHFRYSFLIKSW